jgi:acetyltransferase-like isoleucine patch superfamily enzyme
MKKYKTEILFSAISLISHLIGAILIGLSLAPAYLLVSATLSFTSRLQSQLAGAILIGLSLGAGYYIFSYSLLILIVLARHILQFKNNEMEEDIFSWPGFKFAGFNFLLAIAKHMVLPMFRSTPLIVWFYRGMGAKIGPNTLITTTKIYDCDLLEIGKNCVIGGNVGINAHITSSQGKGILKRVKIGDRVTIGADTLVFAGAVIENNVVIGSSSLVPQDAHLEANSVYAGIPVKKIR